MENQKIIELSYYSCNKDTILLFFIIIIFWIIAFIIIKLFVYSDVLNELGVCNPVYYFWGNKQSCKKEINLNIKNTLYGRESGESFIVNNSSSNSNNNIAIVEPFYDIRNLYYDCKEIVKINSLAMMRFIHSIQYFIYRIILFILNVVIPTTPPIKHNPSIKYT